MAEMTTRERFLRMFAHQEADRVPIIDDPWQGTLRRWHREGMPENVDWRDYFGVDKTAMITVDITPQYPVETWEEGDYVIQKSAWGVTMRHKKELDSTPEFLDYKVVDEESWEECKARMLAGKDRINWKYLEENYPKWKAEGRWIMGEFWFGFDATHSWMMGTEKHLIAMYEEPELVMDMYDTYLNCCIKLYDEMWAKGYTFDAIRWPDDMGYKGTTFFSNEMYRELLKPFHKRAIDWAHDHGIVAQLHSCGNIMTRVDDLMDIGLDCLNPMEIKAGMDPILLKQKYGDKLVLHGGLNASTMHKKEIALAEIHKYMPVLKENGGYIFSSDHSIPNAVSLDTFKAIVEEAKRVGSYK